MSPPSLCAAKPAASGDAGWSAEEDAASVGPGAASLVGLTSFAAKDPEARGDGER